VLSVRNRSNSQRQISGESDLKRKSLPEIGEETLLTRRSDFPYAFDIDMRWSLFQQLILRQRVSDS
jgi:hypothetical protein